MDKYLKLCAVKRVPVGADVLYLGKIWKVSPKRASKTEGSRWLFLRRGGVLALAKIEEVHQTFD